MNYLHYSARDFVKDTYFQQWVLAPDTETNTFWENLLNTHPHKRPEIEQAIEMIRLLAFDTDYQANTDFIEVWQNIQRERHLEQLIPENTPVRTSFFSTWYKAAAIWVGLLIIGSVIFWISQRETTQMYTTRYGEIKTLTLPDHSVVTLNGNSTISFPSDWEEGSTREVWLEGEAFFHVLRQKSQSGSTKFQVHTPHLTIEVVGTEFTVKNRRQTTRVVLSSGKVNLKLEKLLSPQTIDMQPGELAEYTSARKQVKKRSIDPALYTSWLNHQLVFDKTSLQEIAFLLEDNYGLQVVLADKKLAEKRFTGTVPTNNIQLLLTTLTKLYDLQITQHNKQLIIKSRRP